MSGFFVLGGLGIWSLRLWRCWFIRTLTLSEMSWFFVLGGLGIWYVRFSNALNPFRNELVFC